MSHCTDLRRIFPVLKRLRNQEIEQRIRDLEGKAHKLAEDYCNRPMREGEYENRESEIMGALDSILNYRKRKVPVFVNSDPRGRALKISERWVVQHKAAIERDWGGYGIICPEKWC